MTSPTMLPSSRSALAAAALALAACVEFSPDYLQLAPQQAAERELHGRRFSGIGEKELLDASVGVLQDLGFTIETKGAALGFVQGSKEREAKAPEQVLVIVILAALAASQGANASAVPMRQDQTISVLLSVRPARGNDPASHVVVVTFHSHVRQPMQHTAGLLREPQLYQSFFELLSKAIFLEAHKL